MIPYLSGAPCVGHRSSLLVWIAYEVFLQFCIKRQNPPQRRRDAEAQRKRRENLSLWGNDYALLCDPLRLCASAVGVGFGCVRKILSLRTRNTPYNSTWGNRVRKPLVCKPYGWAAVGVGFGAQVFLRTRLLRLIVPCADKIYGGKKRVLRLK